MKIYSITNSDFQVNTYLLISGRTCIITDPGEDSRLIGEHIRMLDLMPLAIVNTHGHVDHTVSVRYFQDRYKVPFAMHSDDTFLLDSLEEHCRRFDLRYQGTPKIDINLKGMNLLTFPGFELTIIHTPGHTPGGVCIQTGDDLLSGDTLFHRSIGRTDLPRGDFEQLRRSIIEKLYTLDDGVRVHPGHGPQTSISTERTANPFINIPE